jgi:hypothetical protein
MCGDLYHPLLCWEVGTWQQEGLVTTNPERISSFGYSVSLSETDQVADNHPNRIIPLWLPYFKNQGKFASDRLSVDASVCTFQMDD